MEVLAIHSSLPSGRTDVPMVPFKQPGHVATLEVALESTPCLPVAKRWIKGGGQSSGSLTAFKASKSSRYVERFGPGE